mmetsp:Transcript_12047/g.23008  ORF Transcript_12047/g.23008 Transcript_12047/m.23008 type:complete len:88 (+) Transcript_12047:276-539(+)
MNQKASPKMVILAFAVPLASPPMRLSTLLLVPQTDISDEIRAYGGSSRERLGELGGPMTGELKKKVGDVSSPCMLRRACEVERGGPR